jgi:hypothetical protein
MTTQYIIIQPIHSLKIIEKSPTKKTWFTENSNHKIQPRCTNSNVEVQIWQQSNMFPFKASNSTIKDLSNNADKEISKDELK